MTAKLLDGASVANRIKEEVAAEVGGVDDGRAVVLVGRVVLVTEIGAEADGGDGEAVEQAEVGRGQPEVQLGRIARGRARGGNAVLHSPG